MEVIHLGSGTHYGWIYFNSEELTEKSSDQLESLQEFLRIAPEIIRMNGTAWPGCAMGCTVIQRGMSESYGDPRVWVQTDRENSSLRIDLARHAPLLLGRHGRVDSTRANISFQVYGKSQW